MHEIGASGFLAAWFIKFLLDRGYSVVGTGKLEQAMVSMGHAECAEVRSREKGEALKRTFPQTDDRLSYAVVQDITIVSRPHPSVTL